MLFQEPVHMDQIESLLQALLNKEANEARNLLKNSEKLGENDEQTERV